MGPPQIRSLYLGLKFAGAFSYILHKQTEGYACGVVHRIVPALISYKNPYPSQKLKSIGVWTLSQYKPTFTASHIQRGIFNKVNVAMIATTDACDANAALLAKGELRVLQPIFKIYGQSRAFFGQIVTLKVFEDNVLVREFLKSKGKGRVLVIDGGGSMKCALVGGNMAQIAQNMGWAGIVVNGCIRDVDEINGCDIGVRALASNPVKSKKKGIGEKHVPLHIAGTTIHDGEWLYADSDGILISKRELTV